MRTSLRALAFVAAFLLAATVFTLAQQNQNVQITKGPAVESVTGNSAKIAWSTNVNAGTVLKYGTDPNNLNQTAEAPWGGLTHRVTLSNLQPNTTYYFDVESAQGQGTGTGAISNVAQFHTQADGATSPASSNPAPGNPPPQASNSPQPYNAASFAVVAGPIPQQVTSNSATLWWETNQALHGSVVKYGTSPNALNQQAPSTQSSDEMSHTAQLTGLQPNTQYFISIVRLDGKTSATGNFKTEAASQASNGAVRITNGPVIEYLASNQAIVSWSTTAPSSSVVKYGTDANSLNQTAQAGWGGTTHRVTLQNLQPNTKYWFQIQSAQAQGTGTATASAAYPFQTVQNGQSAMNIAQH